MSEEIRDTIQPKISLSNLKEAAQKENWGIVDENLPTVCDNPDFVNWALQEGLSDPNGDLRDLAVSLLEKSKHKLEPKEVKKLKRLMGTDKNHYVRFRASFALFNHAVLELQVFFKRYIPH